MECKYADDTAVSAVQAAGINRYIMECKWIHHQEKADAWTELIDTLWNVNEPTLLNHLLNFGN